MAACHQRQHVNAHERVGLGSNGRHTASGLDRLGDLPCPSDRVGEGSENNFDGLVAKFPERSRVGRSASPAGRPQHARLFEQQRQAPDGERDRTDELVDGHAQVAQGAEQPPESGRQVGQGCRPTQQRGTCEHVDPHHRKTREVAETSEAHPERTEVDIRLATRDEGEDGAGRKDTAQPPREPRADPPRQTCRQERDEHQCAHDPD